MNLLIVVNVDTFFLSHRKEIALAALNAGYDVTVVTKDTGHSARIRALGLKTVDLKVNSTGTNILEELATIRQLKKIYSTHRPDIVHHVGLKMILWGTMAARKAGVKGIVNAVSGLGIMFSERGNKALASTILLILRRLHRKPRPVVIFQNGDDRALFYRSGIADERNAVTIKGAGVDMAEFDLGTEPDGETVNILFTGRMIKEKGVPTIIEAAEILKERYRDRLRFILCGAIDKNPSAISERELTGLCDGTYVRWLGHRDDIPEILRSTHIVVFPSYYREGIPKSLIEAAAAGRPIITCDSVGCREVVDDGVNGFLIRPGDSAALAGYISLLADNREKRIEMGRSSRAKALREFDIREVVKLHMDIYESLR